MIGKRAQIQYAFYKGGADSIGYAAVFFGTISIFVPIDSIRLLGIFSLILGIGYFLLKFLVPMPN